MRKIVMCVLLFGFTSAAQAQEPVVREPVPPPLTEEATTPAPDAPAPVVDLKPRSTTAAAIDAATLRAAVDADDTVQDVTAPRNFWWLVGAIVLAGVILAVLL